jgi:hypothetical protein
MFDDREFKKFVLRRIQKCADVQDYEQAGSMMTQLSIEKKAEGVATDQDHVVAPKVKVDPGYEIKNVRPVVTEGALPVELSVDEHEAMIREEDED